MPQETDYNSWPMPDEGADGWHTDYYEFVEDADTKVMQSGGSSARPTTAPDGAWWHDTDEHVFYQYDGTTGDWHARGTYWQGYELVFDNETPETDQYIRLSTDFE